MKSRLIFAVFGVLQLFIASVALAQEPWPPNGAIPAGWAVPPGATAGWAVASDSVNSGSFSLKSASMPDDSNLPGDLRRTAVIEAGGSFSAGTISFAYRVSSEQGFDFFEFYIDGQQMLQQSGDPLPWTTVSFSVPAGNHVFRWAYNKDNSVSIGSDAAWIDTVTLPAGTIQQQLAVSRNGTGSGTVVSSPSGITCGGICYNYFATNSTVTLTASAGPGSGFAGWSGACSGAATTCSVSMTAARTVTATFNQNDDNFPANGALPAGWTTAAPDVPWKVSSDSTFRGPFSLKSGVTPDGQASSIQVTATVVDGTVDFAYRVSSEDQYDTFAFYIDDVIQFPFPASGEIGWTTVSVQVAAGTHVFKFSYQKDDSNSAGSDAAWIDSVVLPTGTSTRLLTVTGAGTGAGTVTSSPAGINCGATCSAFFTTNSTVTLTATPASGSSFIGWSGACTGASAQCQVAMSAAKDVTASFNVVGQTTLSVLKSGSGSGTVTSNPAGISCGSTCSSTFPANSTVTLTAAPNSGSSFTGWSGACSGTALTCQVLIDQAKSATASFAVTSASVTITKTGSGTGTVTSNPSGIDCGLTCTNSFTASSTITLTATPAAGSVFSGWAGACGGTATTCQLTIDSAKAVIATFTPVGNTTSVLTVTKQGSGTGSVTSTPTGIDCGATCSASFPTNSAVTLTATASAGSVFSSWTNGCVGNTTTCQVALDQAKTVVATFSVPSASGVLDVDGSSPNSKYDALTDGLLVIRYLFGLTGTPLVTGATGTTATRNTGPTVKAYLDGVRQQLDVDGNGTSDALTDGLLIIRYLFGLRGTAMTVGAVGNGATRSTAATIEPYIQSLMP